MTMLVKADKDRITIRGLLDGARYLVREQGRGWWVEPAPDTEPRAGMVQDAKLSLSEHLDALKAEGFEFEPLEKEKVPSCGF